jgi:hypothetical protein
MVTDGVLVGALRGLMALRSLQLDLSGLPWSQVTETAHDSGPLGALPSGLPFLARVLEGLRSLRSLRLLLHDSGIGDSGVCTVGRALRTPGPNRRGPPVGAAVVDGPAVFAPGT